MVNKTKRLDIITNFTVEKAQEEAPEALNIEGYANTTTKDRMGDVIIQEAWNKKALENYLKNPIVLAFHNHSKPIGTTKSLKVDENGLFVQCKISEAAGEVNKLIRDGVLKTFSVGFMVKDADYDPKSDIFVIKDLELLEISVVSVPANQDSTFSLAKCFDSDNELKQFKESFIKGATSVVEDETKQFADSKTNSSLELSMTKEELDAMLKETAEKTAKAIADKAAAEKATEEAKKAEDKRIIELGTSGAERLIADITKKLEDQNTSMSKALEDVRAELKEKSDELKAITESKMKFTDKGTDTIPQAEKEAAWLLAKAKGVDITQTKLWDNIVQKYGAHVPHADWEYTISTNMQDEIRRRLVVAPLFRGITMPTPVIKLPVNPEAGYGTWVTSSALMTTASSGAAGTHVLKEITLSAYKLATKEFLGYEEEDDAIIPLLPIVRDAMVRRTAKSVDKGLLRGANTGADPLKGITAYQAPTDNVTVTTSAKVTVANLQTVRKNLGIWGLDPKNVIYLVGSEAYFDLLEDTNFLTMDKVGDKATILTGQIGMVNGSPVIVSGEFAAKAGGTAGSIGAVAVNPANFLVGNYKGLNVETDKNIESQYRVLVASLRMAFQQISTVDGHGASCLRYT